MHQRLNDSGNMPNPGNTTETNSPENMASSEGELQPQPENVAPHTKGIAERVVQFYQGKLKTNRFGWYNH